MDSNTSHGLILTRQSHPPVGTRGHWSPLIVQSLPPTAPGCLLCPWAACVVFSVLPPWAVSLLLINCFSLIRPVLAVMNGRDPCNSRPGIPP